MKGKVFSLSIRFATVFYLASLAPALAQLPGPAMQAAPYFPIPQGQQQVVGIAAAIPLPNIPTGATFAIVVCTGATINWRDDGTAPTTTVGIPVVVNQPIIFAERPLSKVQIIQTAPTATCNVSYYQ